MKQETEMKNHRKQKVIHQADKNGCWSSHVIPQLLAGQRTPSDPYLSPARDVTETSVIFSHCWLRSRGTHMGIWFCFITLLRGAGALKDVGSQISEKQQGGEKIKNTTAARKKTRAEEQTLEWE